MKMIWPGRSLGVALLVPALAVAGLVHQRAFAPARSGDRHGLGRARRSSTCSLSGGPGGFQFERRLNAVCSLSEPGRGRAGPRKPAPHAAVPDGSRRRAG